MALRARFRTCGYGISFRVLDNVLVSFTERNVFGALFETWCISLEAGGGIIAESEFMGKTR